MGQMNQGQPQFDQRQQMQQPMQQRFLQDQSQFNPGQQNGLQGVLAQQQSMHNTPNFFERPSSSSSATHSQQFSQQSPQGQQFSRRIPVSDDATTTSPPAIIPSRNFSIANIPSLWASSSGCAVLTCSGRCWSPWRDAMQRPPSRPRLLAGLIFLARARLSTHLNPQLRFSRRFLTSRSHRLIPLLMRVLRSFTSSYNFSRNNSSNSSSSCKQPQVQTPQGFGQVPGTPVPGSPGRKRRLTGQGSRCTTLASVWWHGWEWVDGLRHE
jgi:hypothetical protein